MGGVWTDGGWWWRNSARDLESGGGVVCLVVCFVKSSNYFSFLNENGRRKKVSPTQLWSCDAHGALPFLGLSSPAASGGGSNAGVIAAAAVVGVVFLWYNEIATGGDSLYFFFNYATPPTPHPHHHHAPPPQSAATGTLLSEWSGRVHVCHIRHLLTSDALPRLLCPRMLRRDSGTTEAAENGITTAPDRKIPLSKGAQAASRHSSSFSFSRFHRLFLFPCTTSSSGRSKQPLQKRPFRPLRLRRGRRQNVAPLYADMSDAQIETIAEEEEKIAACESIRRAKQRIGNRLQQVREVVLFGSPNSFPPTRLPKR